MKKKNAFTLIELLAVIVILAIIALIAVPQIMKILNQARLKSAEDATYGMIKSTESFLASQILIEDSDDNDFEFICDSDGVCKDEKSESYVLDYKGKKITGGTIKVKDRKLIQVNEIIAFGFKCSKDYDEEIVHCTPLNGSEKPQEQTESLLKEGINCGAMTEENYDATAACYIENMNDFNGFRSLINEKNKDFTNKKVYLVRNLDFTGLNYEKIKTFNGNFYGNNKILSNITINENSDNTAIFEANSGTIEWLKINDLKIENSQSYTASLVGYNTGNIYGITLNNIDVTGGSYTAGLVGHTTNGVVSEILINGIILNGSSLGQIVGVREGNATVINSIVTNSTSSAGNAGWSQYGNNVPGFINPHENLSILSYDKVVDTYINGDDNANGYYFDYSDLGGLEVKNVKDSPLEFNLQGEGTESNPYIISNVEEWKQATLRGNETDVHFKVTKDIDFKNKFYPFNTFNGNINGYGHTLSNINTYDESPYVGLFSRNNGTIEWITINNLKIENTQNYTAGLVGYNTGNIYGITLNNVDVTGGRYTAGLVGYTNNGEVSETLINGIALNGSNLGQIVGVREGNATVINSIVMNSTSSASLVGWSQYGNNVPGFINPHENLSILTYDKIVDTYINGDENDNGYYFDYSSNGNMEVKCIINSPLNFNLSGNGTESNPYKITSINDWKKATLKGNESNIYFEITQNLDFNNDKKFYPFNTFNGNLNGNGHTLSNIDIYDENAYAGIFSINSGTIEWLKIDNLKIESTKSYTSGLVGNNSGNVFGISLSNVNITGSDYTAGFVGYTSSGNASDLLIDGITINGSRIGQAVGTREGSGVVQNVVVKNSNSSSGLAGWSQYGNSIPGIVNPSSAMTLEQYNNKVNTSISGDTDSNGYYFDFDSSNNLIIKKV